MLPDCPNLSRFLTPATSVAAQVTAYDMILQTLSPNCQGHKVDTMKHLDSLIVPYLALADMADQSESPVLAETRAFNLMHVGLSQLPRLMQLPQVQKQIMRALLHKAY